MIAAHGIVIGYIIQALRHINAPTNTAPYRKKGSGSMESKMQFWSSIRNLGLSRLKTCYI